MTPFAEENFMEPEAYRKIKQVYKAKVCAIENMKEMYFKTYLSCTLLLFIKAGSNLHINGMGVLVYFDIES